MSRNARESVRLQCGNSDNILFSLVDNQTGKPTGFCVCSDLSEVGGHFFTDQEFQPGQKMTLSITVDNRARRDVAATVVRADDHLYDEERFCAALAFDEPLTICKELKTLQSKITNLIAA